MFALLIAARIPTLIIESEFASASDLASVQGERAFVDATRVGHVSAVTLRVETATPLVFTTMSRVERARGHSRWAGQPRGNA